MSVRSREELKAFFETGDHPTQEQFGDLIDSMMLVGDDVVIFGGEPVCLRNELVTLH